MSEIATNKCPGCGKPISPITTEYEDDGETPKVALVKCICGFYKKYNTNILSEKFRRNYGR